jgi:hypothetical protein
MDKDGAEELVWEKAMELVHTAYIFVFQPCPYSSAFIGVVDTACLIS